MQPVFTTSHDDGNVSRAQSLDVPGHEGRTFAQTERCEPGHDRFVDVQLIQDRKAIRSAWLGFASMAAQIANDVGSQPGRGALRVSELAQVVGCIGERVGRGTGGSCPVTDCQQERESMQRRPVDIAERGVQRRGAGLAGMRR